MEGECVLTDGSWGWVWLDWSASCAKHEPIPVARGTDAHGQACVTHLILKEPPHVNFTRIGKDMILQRMLRCHYYKKKELMIDNMNLPPLKVKLKCSPLSKWENWGSERLSSLTKKKRRTARKKSLTSSSWENFPDIHYIPDHWGRDNGFHSPLNPSNPANRKKQEK